MVSGAAAVAYHSELDEWARLLHHVGLAARVGQAEQALSQTSFTAIVTGRLIPGGRTPVIAALGLSGYPIRRFLPASIVACGLWASIYSSIGTIGGKVASRRPPSGPDQVTSQLEPAAALEDEV